MLSTLIKEFQKFPMWVRHPNETEALYRPTIVNNEEQLKEYLSKGYVAPHIDEAAFKLDDLWAHPQELNQQLSQCQALLNHLQTGLVKVAKRVVANAKKKPKKAASKTKGKRRAS